jgi:hypothetical protein
MDQRMLRAIVRRLDVLNRTEQDASRRNDGEGRTKKLFRN